MENIAIEKAELGILGWFIVIVVGMVIMGLFSKKNKDKDESSKSED